MSYRKVLNGIAYKVYKKPVEIPDYHLMIGTAEHLDEIPLLISQAKIPSKVAKNIEKIETVTGGDIEQAIADNILEVNDYNGNTAILAGMIGGVK